MEFFGLKVYFSNTLCSKVNILVAYSALYTQQSVGKFGPSVCVMLLKESDQEKEPVSSSSTTNNIQAGTPSNSSGQSLE